MSVSWCFFFALASVVSDYNLCSSFCVCVCECSISGALSLQSVRCTFLSFFELFTFEAFRDAIEKYPKVCMLHRVERRGKNGLNEHDICMKTKLHITNTQKVVHMGAFAFFEMVFFFCSLSLSLSRPFLSFSLIIQLAVEIIISFHFKMHDILMHIFYHFRYYL